MSVRFWVCFVLLLAVGIDPCWCGGIADHRCIDIGKIPRAAVERARERLHIAYGHTSHGSQVTDGMTGLVGFMNGLGHPTDLYDWNEGGTGGALDIDDWAMGGDAGYYPDWVNNTRAYLGSADAQGRGSLRPLVNVVIWSWCGQVSGMTEQEITDRYLSPMTQLEQDYPGITFVYMTGHADGSGLTGNLHLRNRQIREYCRAGNRFLYDFYDIECHDPDGNYYGDKAVTDECWYDSDGNGSRDANWGTLWQDSHTVDVDWYACGSAHTEPVNANQKAYAAWWLWARIAGWNPAAGAPARSLLLLGQ